MRRPPARSTGRERTSRTFRGTFCLAAGGPWRLKVGGFRPTTPGMAPDPRDHARAERPPAEPHRLWWRPGDGHGRGILFDSGHVHTWPEAEGEHRHMADLRAERPVMFFLIRPDGRVRIPRRHAGRAAEHTEALLAADGRLRPFDPYAEPAAA